MKQFFLWLSPLLIYKISGHSMFPTISQGQIVFVNRLSFLFQSPRVNDIVAAKIAGHVMIKRIKKISKGKFFLSGDNAADSLDSRQFGFVAKEQIVGRVII